MKKIEKIFYLFLFGIGTSSTVTATDELCNRDDAEKAIRELHDDLDDDDDGTISTKGTPRDHRYIYIL